MDYIDFADLAQQELDRAMREYQPDAERTHSTRAQTWALLAPAAAIHEHAGQQHEG